MKAVVAKETKDLDFPKLMIDSNDNIFLITKKCHNYSTYEGTNIVSKGSIVVGVHSSQWADLTDFKGKITIEQ